MTFFIEILYYIILFNYTQDNCRFRQQTGEQGKVIIKWSGQGMVII